MKEELAPRREGGANSFLLEWTTFQKGGKQFWEGLASENVSIPHTIK